MLSGSAGMCTQEDKLDSTSLADLEKEEPDNILVERTSAMPTMRRCQNPSVLPKDTARPLCTMWRDTRLLWMCSSCTRRGYTRCDAYDEGFDFINKECDRLDAEIQSATEKKRKAKANVQRLKAEKKRLQNHHHSLVRSAANDLLESEERDEAERAKVDGPSTTSVNGFSEEDPFQSLRSLADLPDFDMSAAFPMFDAADIATEETVKKFQKLLQEEFPDPKAIDLSGLASLGISALSQGKDNLFDYYKKTLHYLHDIGGKDVEVDKPEASLDNLHKYVLRNVITRFKEGLDDADLRKRLLKDPNEEVCLMKAYQKAERAAEAMRKEKLKRRKKTMRRTRESATP